MAEHSISIVIVDNHRLVREGLRALLENQAQFAVASNADYQNAARVIGGLAPDIVLLSLISNSSHDFLAKLKEFQLISPATHFLILAHSVDDQNILQALRCGALGCLTSDSSVQDLIHSILELAHGGSYLPSEVGRKLIQRISAANARTTNGQIVLSPQQMRVLKYICHGYTNEDIAGALEISKRTVEMHTYRLFKRLNATSRSQAIQIAARLGLIEIGEFSVELASGPA